MFPSKPFCVTVPNNFIGEPFTVALISGIEKIRIREGEYQKIPSKTFVSQWRKLPYWGTLSVSLISGTEKVWIREGGGSRISVENFLSHSAEIFRRGILYCCNFFGN